MPTEAQIEAAADSDAKFDGRSGLSRMGRADRARYIERARAALTAAEAVEVSEEDAGILVQIGCLISVTDGPVAEVGLRALSRLLALARRGAGQAVPDEAAILADERERLAKVMDAVEAALFAQAEVMGHTEDQTGYGPASEFVHICQTARDYAFAAKAIRAAIAKAEGRS